MADWNAGQTVLDGYLIEKELGRGGMGCVWLVKSNSTGHRFAVKQALLKEEKHRKAFLAELQTWIDLPEHPNIVPCRFFRTVGDEVLIFAEYVEGGSLKEWIDSKKLYEGGPQKAVERILDISIQFAWGLHCVHELGVVHQDVKPGNVLMVNDGSVAVKGVRPKVTDFGLARAWAPDSVTAFQPQDRKSAFISFGGMTPAYASPEQRAGKLLSPKTDIWSWGVSILDMFMGGISCPYGGHIALDVLESFVENKPEGGMPFLPHAVADILRKCFASNPLERWKDINEAASALATVFHQITGCEYQKQLQTGIPVSLTSVQHDRRIMNINWRDPREWLREANIAIGRDPAEADNYQVSPAYTRKGAGVADLALFDEAERLFRSKSSASDNASVNLARLYNDKALLCKSLDDITGCLQAYDQCHKIYFHLVIDKKLLVLVGSLSCALTDCAVVLTSMGDYQRALILYDMGIECCEWLVNEEERSEWLNYLANFYMNKALTVFNLGDSQSAIALCDRSIHIYDNLVKIDGRSDYSIQLASFWMNKAVVLMNIGDIPNAVSLFDHGIDIYERMVNLEGHHELSSSLADIYANKAAALISQIAVNQEASLSVVTLYTRAIAIYEHLVNNEDRRDLADRLANLYMGTGIALVEQQNVPAAIDLYDRAIALYDRLITVEGHSEFSGNTAHVLLYAVKAEANMKQNKFRNALTLYDKAIELFNNAHNLSVRNGVDDIFKDVFKNRLYCLTQLNEQV